MNVYLLEEEGGITLFDAGVRSMVDGLRSVAEPLGGIKRIVLGHAHTDHRGAAPGLGMPTFCHPAERADAEGDAGLHYFTTSELNPVHRRIMPMLLRMWDGGPVTIAGTVDEGEEVAGFEVVHIPGHAPGQIALWRASDRLALTTDAFYTLNPLTGFKSEPRLALNAFNLDSDQARKSLLKLADLDPASAWPGHADPLTANVADTLRRIANV
jgi:glyoxylase-like metal-dependent hydrolase (beta-lactamase superfamily II)